MLGTVVQWLVLATITGAVVGTGTSLFLYVLFILTDESIAVPFWLQLVLLPLGGLINGLLLYYGYRANTSGIKDSMLAAVYEQGGKMRSEEKTYELQALMRNSHAVFCLQKKT